MVVLRNAISSIFFLILLAFFPQAALAYNFPTPGPTSQPNTLTHIPTYVQFTNTLNSCYHVGSVAFNGACGSGNQGMPTPGPSGAPSDWTTLSNYVSYVEGNTAGINIITSGGVKYLFYIDPEFIHGPNNFSGGITNAIQGSSYNAASLAVCPNAYPPAVQLTTTFYGIGVYMPTVNVSSCGGSYYGSILGDVGPGAVDAWQQDIEAQGAQIPLNGLGGYGGSINGQILGNGLWGVRMDDMDYPGRRFANQILCLSSAAPLGTSNAGATVTSCGDSRLSNSGSPTAATRGDHPYFHMGLYPQAMDPNWVEGVRSLFRMTSKMGLVTVFNDYTDPTVYQYFNTRDRSNVAMAQCESCITRNGYAGNVFWPEYIWQNHVNSEIVAGEWGVIFHLFNVPEQSVADSQYAYASLWLGMRSAAYVAVTDQFTTGLTVPNSLLSISPFVWIVPTGPINTPQTYYFDPIKVNYNPTTTTAQTSFGVGTLKQTGGAYLREFQTCYRGDSLSSVAIGPCAAVVNATGSNVTMPNTVQTYGHTATFTGSGIITPTIFGGGDTGSLNVAGATPPISGATIPANTAYLLTQ